MAYIPYISGTLGGRVQELCESRGGRPGFYVLTSLTVSVDVKQRFGTGHSLSLICQPTSEDMKLYIIINTRRHRCAQAQVCTDPVWQGMEEVVNQCLEFCGRGVAVGWHNSVAHTSDNQAVLKPATGVRRCE